MATVAKDATTNTSPLATVGAAILSTAPTLSTPPAAMLLFQSSVENVAAL